VIGRLHGKLVEKKPPHLVIDVNGVGYELEAPMTTFYGLPNVGGEIHLFTHMAVREDAHLLFGFASEQERRLFRALLKVNGVGAKLALAIISGIEPDRFAICVHEGDAARLTSVPGIGKKTAERLIVEMRDRLADWRTDPAVVAELRPTAGGRERNDTYADAVAGLVSLGYKPQEASRLIHSLDILETATSEEIIREALRAAVSP
jgi:Holliday junction DNA helicase RuvA